MKILPSFTNRTYKVTFFALPQNNENIFVEEKKKFYLSCKSPSKKMRFSSFFLDVILYFLGLELLVEISKFLFLSQSETMLRYIAAIFYFVYFVVPLFLYGGSPAKLILGLRVLDVDHANYPSFTSAVLREIFCKPLLGYIGNIDPFFWGIRKDKKTLTDILCHHEIKNIREYV